MLEDMKIDIQKIVEFNNTLLPVSKQKNKHLIDCLVLDTISKYEENKYDFSLFESLTLKQNCKLRDVKKYKDWSVEQFLCIYLKRCLDREFRIRYPNRNEQIRILFETVSSIQNMKDFTIIKFDFSDFFNTISSEYVYLKFIDDSNLERFQKDLLKRFVEECQYSYAGINTSNVLAEIIGRFYDQILTQSLYEKGLIFYRRYVDDGILIFNRFISESEGKTIIETAIETVFYDPLIDAMNKCKTSLNMNTGKFTYISKRDIDKTNQIKHTFDFLGYQFELYSDSNKKKRKTNIKYGITDSKVQKYKKKIDKIIEEYKDDNDIELLRHRLKAFCCRTVYRRNKYKIKIWKSKGFISNYNELRYFVDKLDTTTEHFLKTAITDSFSDAGISLPFFLMGKSDESPYSLYNNLKSNRTLLFEENEYIGINTETLVKMCTQLGITPTLNWNYNSLLREYLIKIRIGH